MKTGLHIYNTYTEPLIRIVISKYTKQIDETNNNFIDTYYGTF